LSGLVRRPAAVRQARDQRRLRVRADRCIRHAHSQVDREDLAARDRDSQAVQGRALALDRAGRVPFRLRAKLRRAKGQDSGRGSVAAASATRR